MPSSINATEIEKSNLESHVELCALRYRNLETRLGNIESKVEKLATNIQASQNSMNKVIIGATGTIIAALISAVVSMKI